MTKKYKSITASGTFDHFHLGHEAFLLGAFDQANHVYIGITSDSYPFQKLFTMSLEPFSKRKEQVELFLAKHKLLERSTIFALKDLYGPLLSEKNYIEAIAVTADTEKSALQINKKRKEHNLSPLPIVVIPLVTKNNLPLSSTRIRSGELNRQGEKTLPESLIVTNHNLPKDLRQKLQKPTGKLYVGSEHHLYKAVEKVGEEIKHQKDLFIITVGDVVTQSFQKHHIPISIAIVDLKVQRKQAYTTISEHGFEKNSEAIIENQPGRITKDLVLAIQKALRNDKKTQVLEVNGEEDLAVIPAILLAPLESRIYYGQPHEGVVEVIVTEEKKEEMKQIANLFQEDKI